MTLRESRCREIITRYYFLVNKTFYQSNLFLDDVRSTQAIGDIRRRVSPNATRLGRHRSATKVEDQTMFGLPPESREVQPSMRVARPSVKMDCVQPRTWGVRQHRGLKLDRHIEREAITVTERVVTRFGRAEQLFLRVP